MHELLLFAVVPPLQTSHTLSLLAGIAAHQPQRVTERRLIFKPSRAARFSASRATGSVPAVMQDFMSQMKGDVYYLQVVGTAFGEEVPRLPSVLGGEDKDEARGGEGGIDGLGLDPKSASIFSVEDRGKEAEWSLEFRDLPEPGKGRPVTSRLMASVRLSNVDVVSVMEGMGYSFVSEQLLSGHAFTHQSTRLFLHRPLFHTNATSSPPTPMPNSALSPTSWDEFVPYDPTGAHLLQASLRIQDGAKPELVTRGSAELVRLKEMLKGAVELEVGDRLALDTRVRG